MAIHNCHDDLNPILWQESYDLNLDLNNGYLNYSGTLELGYPAASPSIRSNLERNQDQKVGKKASVRTSKHRVQNPPLNLDVAHWKRKIAAKKKKIATKKKKVRWKAETVREQQMMWV